MPSYDALTRRWLKLRYKEFWQICDASSQAILPPTPQHQCMKIYGRSYGWNLWLAFWGDFIQKMYSDSSLKLLHVQWHCGNALILLTSLKIPQMNLANKCCEVLCCNKLVFNKTLLILALMSYQSLCFRVTYVKQLTTWFDNEHMHNSYDFILERHQRCIPFPSCNNMFHSLCWV